MRIVSFNTNGIRARSHQLAALKQRYGPDVIGIQETKVRDSEFPLEMTGDLGYESHYFGQKGHYGVALLSPLSPVSVQMGNPQEPEDAQRRLISGVYEASSGKRITIVNGYFPQGDSRSHEVKFPAKRQFYADLLKHFEERLNPEEYVVLMGDMNVAPHDLDIGIGADNAKRWLRSGKCSFLPEEREWLQRLADWGLVDSYRSLYPDAGDRFSWFDYRSRGFDRDPKRGLRIDFILATASLNALCSGAGIAYDIRGMEKPSDHCPIWADFDI
ncbi:MAG: exodeoxyribonuclease III [Gammaproteobacteria bacterium]|nr:exodeoxyribonuclease III [Gammaproteobacteria bacterium]